MGKGALPSVPTPTVPVFPGQLSLQPPPAGESTTCVIVTSENPNGNVGWNCQAPVLSARTVKSRGPILMFTSAKGNTHAGSCACVPPQGTTWPGTGTGVPSVMSFGV